MSEENNEPRALITLGYTTYVTTWEEAATIARALARAERYESKANYDTSPTTVTHHIYTEGAPEITIKPISADLYRMAKLAGAPEGKK